MEWHDAACRRLDLASIGGMRSCLSCGSFEEPCPEDDASLAVKPVAYTPSLSQNGGALEEASPHHTRIHQQSETRILILHPGEFGDPICGDLIMVDLPSPYPYEALSYTWADESGDVTLRKTIQLSGRPFLVTSNCENALRRLRRRFTTRRVWVDAICIDQNNLSERGHQVQLMPRIYSGAQCVLIYVGEAADGSDDMLSAISSPDRQSHWRALVQDRQIQSFFQRRYFHRLWVLQEVTLARRAVLICGDFNVPWNLLKSSLAPLGGNRIFYKPPVISFDHITYTDPRQLAKTINLAAQCECQDPRDKVYGLLGLFPHTAGRAIVPDYSLSVKQVYADMAKCIASEFTWSFVFHLALALRENSPTDSDMPTWIPDYSDMPTWIPDWRHFASVQISHIDPKDSMSHFELLRFDRRLRPGGWKKLVSVVERLRFDKTLKLNPDLSLEMRVLKISGVEQRKASRNGDLSHRQGLDLAPRYYLFEGEEMDPSTRIVMFVRGGVLFDHFVNHPKVFIRSGSSRLFDNFKPSPVSFNLRIPLTCIRTGHFCIGEVGQAGDRSNFRIHQYLVFTVTDLLDYLLEHTNVWDQLSPKMVGWNPGYSHSSWSQYDYSWELRGIVARLPPVDKDVEALWPTPEPGDDKGKLHGDKPRGNSLLTYWIGKERFLAWKILLRMCLVTEFTAVIV